MKAKVKITGARKARENATKFLTEFTNSKENLNFLGKLASDQIRSRVRSAGRQDKEYKQPNFSTSTPDIRERLIRAGNSFNSTIVKAKRSNLSMSGQLLDAIKWTITQARGEVTLLLNSSRRKYKGLRKAQLDGATSNIEVKEDLEKRGFRFFFISKNLSTLLETKIAQQLRQKLSLYNKIIRRL